MLKPARTHSRTMIKGRNSSFCTMITDIVLLCFVWQFSSALYDPQKEYAEDRFTTSYSKHVLFQTNE